MSVPLQSLTMTAQRRELRSVDLLMLSTAVAGFVLLSVHVTLAQVATLEWNVEFVLRFIFAWSALAIGLMGLSVFTATEKVLALHAAICGFSGALVTVFAQMHALTLIPAPLMQAIASFGCVLQVFSQSYLVTNFLRVHKSAPTSFALFNAMVMAGFSATVILAGSYIDPKLSANASRQLSLTLIIGAMAFHVIMLWRQSQQQSHEWESPASQRSLSRWGYFRSHVTKLWNQNQLANAEASAVLFILAQSLICWTLEILILSKTTSPTWLDADTLMFIRTLDFISPTLIFLLLALDQFYRRERLSNSQLAATAGHARRRFVSRFQNQSDSMTAAAGVRAPVITVLHDPHAMIQSCLPVSLRQIRIYEITQMLTRLLGDKILEQYADDSNIQVTLDPESSIRPCVDALKALVIACRDGLPLVNERFLNLTELLPIMDPALKVNDEWDNLKIALTHSPWVSQLDYPWTDQQLVPGFHQNAISSAQSQNESGSQPDTPKKLNTTQTADLQIALTEEAFNRLLIEAPMLSGCRLEINSTHKSKYSSRQVILSMEKTISVLNEYFDLENFSSVLWEFPTSPATQQFLDYVKALIPKVETFHHARTLLGYLENYSWRGFKEKNSALRILLELHQKVSKMSQWSAQNQTDADLWRLHFLEVIKSIGYPSQILHHAFQHKFSLRLPENIINTAQQAKNPRFHEAWLVLASGNFDKMGQETVQSLLQFLCAVPAIHDIRRDPFVMAKSTESIANLLAQTIEPTPSLLDELFSKQWSWFLAAEVSPELFSQLMDVQIFVETRHNLKLMLPEGVWTLVERYVADCKNPGLKKRLEILSVEGDARREARPSSHPISA